MTDNSKSAVLCRPPTELVKTVHKTAARLGMSISDYGIRALARQVVEDAEAVSLANHEHESEIQRLSALATGLTSEIAGKRRGGTDV